MFSVIVCSIDPAKAQALHDNIAQTIGMPFEFMAFDNRKARQGICSVYNALAREARYDRLCFLHEDVKFLTPGWGAIIAEQLERPRCGVIGFAGGTMKLRNITAWCLDDRDARTNYRQPDPSGVVHEHRNNPEHERFSRVVALDGFCLITRREIWEASPFDEQTLKGFHGYDLDFTLAAACRFENQVCHTVDLEHLSGGAYTPAWRTALEAVHAKWHDRLPIFTTHPSARKIAALEFRAETLWWRKLSRLGLCTCREGLRAACRSIGQRPFGREGWLLLYKCIRYALRTKHQTQHI